MKRILVLGAGRSSSALIDYLLNKSYEQEWKITVADQSEQAAKSKTGNHPNGEGRSINIENSTQKEQLIGNHDLIISLLPPSFHSKVAACCIKLKKCLLTASYVSEEISELSTAAANQGVTILMEMGLDPGIDHMSCMEEIESIRSKKGVITSFRSYTGGLVAPESDNNPWHYKFTWNPKNVVLAGQGTVKYLENGKYKFIPYHKLFERAVPINIDKHGIFEGYANRDSLKYLSLYNLSNTKTFIRGTLRVPPFCQAWNLFVQLGLTSDNYEIEDSENLSWEAFIDSYLPESDETSVKQKTAKYLGINEDSEAFKLLEWTGIFSKEKTGLTHASPADLLLHLLDRKWKFEPNDLDMIAMQHEIIYQLASENRKITSTLVVKGDAKHSAMAKTVGYPLGIAAKLILQGRISQKGIIIPVSKEIYQPVLEELAQLGIIFKRKEEKI